MTTKTKYEWRWAACSIVEFGPVGEKRHLVAKGSLDTWCGHSATTPEIWRANTSKPKCESCVKQEARLLPPKTTMTADEQDQLGAVREAMKDPNVALHIVHTFTHGRAVQVKIRTRKIGPMFFPNEGEKLADVFRLLGSMADE
jgi:hypothetical protein